ncbi:hypothetical protein GCM10017687_34300 [Streptomyces echinatus]
MTAHLPTCSCCGDTLSDGSRVDIGFNLPDAALRAPEATRHQLGVRALMRVDGVGCFVRCLLPVSLTQATELVMGMWLEVDDATLRRAQDLWEDPRYADLSFQGKIANRIQPWGDELVGAEVTARVGDAEELPYVVTGHGPPPPASWRRPGAGPCPQPIPEPASGRRADLPRGRLVGGADRRPGCVLRRRDRPLHRPGPQCRREPHGGRRPRPRA